MLIDNERQIRKEERDSGMEKKNNKALFIVIGILGGLVLLLLLLVIVLLLFSGIGRQMQNKDDPPGPRITKDENTTEDDILGDEVIRGPRCRVPLQ